MILGCTPHLQIKNYKLVLPSPKFVMKYVLPPARLLPPKKPALSLVLTDVRVPTSFTNLNYKLDLPRSLPLRILHEDVVPHSTHSLSALTLLLPDISYTLQLMINFAKPIILLKMY